MQAAGGVVSRAGEGGVLEVLLVHRPKYDDWSLPKGKLEPGETHEEAALREVEEETGLVCELGRELPSISYRDGKDRPKVVRYWAMELVDGGGASSTSGSSSGFEANAEVDELAWLPPDEARARLVYLPDAEIVDRFLASWL